MNALNNDHRSAPALRDIHLPAPLQDLPIFLCWQFEPRFEGDPKPRKVPYYSHGGRRSGRQGTPQDREKLTTFAVAREQALKRGMTGIGIALLEGYNLIAVDADNCVVDGKVPPEIVEAIGSTYAEYSPSGNGIRAILQGNIGNHKAPTTNADWGWEVFSTTGFCTLTGNALTHVAERHLQDTIGPVTDGITALCERRFGSRAGVPNSEDFMAGREPKLGMTMEQMSDLLERLDPDMSRGDWIKVGLALHHECEGDETGFDLWNSWSEGGGKYLSEDDVRYQWDSFRGPTVGRHSVTMASVIRMARDAGVPPEGAWPPPRPLPDALLPVPDMTKEMLPKELAPWLIDIAERMSVPLDFVGIPAMVMLGTLIGRKVLVRPEEYTDWSEPANLWGAIIASPGAMKTPVVNQVFAPIKRFEAEAQAANRALTEQHQVQSTLVKSRADAALAAAKRNPGASPADLERVLMECATEPQKPKLKRYMTTDATVEKLGEICADNPDGILYHRDELPTLFQEIQREEKAAVRGFLLTGWAGLEAYTFDRIQRGTTFIEAVNISLFGTAQPQRIANLVASSTAKHDDGMIQRLQLLAWPDFVSDWVPADRMPDQKAQDAAFACCQRLSELTASAADTDADGAGARPFLRLTGNALEVFNTYRADLEARVRSRSLPEPLAAHLSKFRGLIPRLALILHLAGGGRGKVTEEAMQVAVNWARYLEAHARRMYASVDMVTADTAGLILRRIRNGALADGFSQRDITQKDWSGLRDARAVQEALTTLQEHGWLRLSTTPTSGRPKDIYHINPAARPKVIDG